MVDVPEIVTAARAGGGFVGLMVQGTKLRQLFANDADHFYRLGVSTLISEFGHAQDDAHAVMKGYFDRQADTALTATQAVTSVRDALQARYDVLVKEATALRGDLAAAMADRAKLQGLLDEATKPVEAAPEPEPKPAASKKSSKEA